MHYLTRYGPDAFIPLHSSQKQLSTQISTIRQFYSSSMFQTKPVISRSHKPHPHPNSRPPSQRCMKGKLIDVILDLIRDTKDEIAGGNPNGNKLHRNKLKESKTISKEKKNRSVRVYEVNSMLREKSVDVIPIVLRKRPENGEDKSSGFRTPRLRLKSSSACFSKSKTEGREDKSGKEERMVRVESNRERRKGELVRRRVVEVRAPKFRNEELAPWCDS